MGRIFWTLRNIFSFWKDCITNSAFSLVRHIRTCFTMSNDKRMFFTFFCDAWNNFGFIIKGKHKTKTNRKCFLTAFLRMLCFGMYINKMLCFVTRWLQDPPLCNCLPKQLSKIVAEYATRPHCSLSFQNPIHVISLVL
jgi:hypothetical protein